MARIFENGTWSSGAAAEAGHLLGHLPRKMPGRRALVWESLFLFRERKKVFVCDLVVDSLRTLGVSEVMTEVHGIFMCFSYNRIYRVDFVAVVGHL